MKDNNIKVYSSSDYAGLETQNYSFYYGYEVEDEDGNWCFTASEQENGNEIIRYSSLELEADDEYPELGLLKGIGKFIEEKLY